jgi:hypothetical protein
MIDPGVGTPPGSYWGRYVPIAAALTVFGSLVMWLPGGQIVVPAVLSVQLLSRTEDSIQRYLPLIVAAAMVTALVPPFWILAVTAVAAGIVLESGIRRAVEWRVLSVATALPLFVGTGLPALLIDSATLEQQWRVMMEPFLGSGGEQLNEAVQWAFDLMLRLMPSLLVCGAVVSGLLALTAVTWWLRRQGSDPRVRVPGLAMWVLPEAFVWPTAAGLALLVAGSGWLRNAGLNIVVIAAFFYSIQGMAIIWYDFIRRDIPVWMRAMFIVVMIVPVIGMLLATLMVLLGLMETWIPFRRLMAAGAGNGDEEE